MKTDSMNISLQTPIGTGKELPLLQVNQLSKTFGQRRAVDSVSFELYAGDVLAVVGESGSGK